MMGPTILGCCGPQKLPEQGRCNGDVLACLGEVWEHFIVLDDPLVHVAGHGMCTPTISMAFDISLELHALLLKLESCFLELLVSGHQLLCLQARWGPCIPLYLIIKVIH